MQTSSGGASAAAAAAALTVLGEMATGATGQKVVRAVQKAFKRLRPTFATVPVLATMFDSLKHEVRRCIDENVDPMMVLPSAILDKTNDTRT